MAKIAALISTGKDSTLATQQVLEQGHDVPCFVTIHSENEDSFMYHGPNTSLAELHAQAADRPLITVESEGEKEDELGDLRDAMLAAQAQYGIDGVVTGAIHSEYQKERVDQICDDLDLDSHAPLWHMDQEDEVQLALDTGLRFIIVKIAAAGLDKDWLGRVVNDEALEDLKELREEYDIHLAGEGGEYETFVTDAPHFEKTIEITKNRIAQQSDHEATLYIEDAKLVEKDS